MHLLMSGDACEQTLHQERLQVSSYDASSDFERTEFLPIVSGVVRSCTALSISCDRRIICSVIHCKAVRPMSIL